MFSLLYVIGLIFYKNKCVREKLEVNRKGGKSYMNRLC